MAVNDPNDLLPLAVNLIRTFLASPADASEERVIVQKVVGELNRSIARSIGVFLDLVRWEDFIPGMGRPQQIILDQANIEETDLFVGVLWNRFGTPTGHQIPLRVWCWLQTGIYTARRTQAEIDRGYFYTHMVKELADLAAKELATADVVEDVGRRLHYLAAIEVWRC